MTMISRPDSGDCRTVSVLIPALNEEASLPLVLRDLPVGQVNDVLVVDNGSHDHTAEVARAAGARVVQEPRRGYGAACLSGLADLARRPEGPPDIVVFLDADYSDHPEELSYLVRPILDDRFDLVLGSRLTGRREPGAMPPQSVWGNRLACVLMRLFFGARYTDLGPFRAIRWTALEQLGMVDQNYGWTVEMQIKAARLGLRVLEVPVSYRRRIGTSKISGTVRGTILAGSKILYLIARYGLSRCRSPRSDDQSLRAPEATEKSVIRAGNAVQ
jgi:glycosyltransferase involved in cell wall biosynthesis